MWLLFNTKNLYNKIIIDITYLIIKNIINMINKIFVILYNIISVLNDIHENYKIKFVNM